MSKASERKLVGPIIPPRDHVVVGGYLPLSKAKIDRALSRLIRDLNKAGYVTVSSCQGRTKPGDSHHLRAHIGFNRRLSYAFARRCARAGLLVYDAPTLWNARISGPMGEQPTIMQISLWGDYVIGTDVWEGETSEEEAIAKNALFVPTVRSLFGLLGEKKV